MTERSVLVRLRADISDFNKKMAEAGLATKELVSGLDSSGDRMSNLIQFGLALGPALVPIGAAAVPAISGLTAALGFAAVGAGATVLAFQGVGTALKALNTYQLEPTAAHLQALNVAMGALGPAGRDFVHFLQDLRPKLQGLQDIAQAGILPGVQTGIDELMTRLPEVERILDSVSQTVGRLFSEAGASVAGPKFDAFFTYLQNEASPALIAMGKAAGNVVLGLSDLVMAFDPLNDDFFSGIVKASQAFADWSHSLSGTVGFQHFLDYVQSVGPTAWKTLGDIALALISIVHAAAPVGGVVLHGLDALAKTFAYIADSPVGPVLLGAATAIATLSRALFLLRSVQFKELTDTLGRFTKFKLDKSAVPSVRDLGTYMYGLGQQSKYASDKTLVARDTVKGFAKAIAPGALAAAGLAIAMTGVADQTGLSNTASLALTGTLFGPWGTAVGAGIGLAKDFTAAHKGLDSAMQAVNRSASNPLGIAQRTADIEAATKALDAYRQKVADASDISKIGSVSGTLAMFGEPFTHKIANSTTELLKQANATRFLKDNLDDLSYRLNGNDFSKFNLSVAQAQALSDKLAPALQRAGINADILNHAMTMQQEGQVIKAWHDYVASIDTAAGRSKAVGEALTGMGDAMKTTQDKADALKTALDNLFGPGLNLSAATDAYTTKLQALGKALKAAKGDLTSNSKAALAARDATRGVVQALSDKAVADAAVNHNGARTAQILLAGRDAIIAQGRAAGISKGKMAGYLATLGLTPQNLTTIILTPGLLTAKEQVKALNTLYGLTPKQKHTIMAAINAGKTHAEVQSLLDTYKLTPKQKQTLLQAIDHATAVVRRVNAERLHDKQVTITTRLVTQMITQKFGPNQSSPLPKASSANGNIFRAFAAGDVANQHLPQIAAPVMRVWAEPETQGESYIPLANDWRRPRAIAIWEETGRILGLQFKRYAAGGFDAARAQPNRSTTTVVNVAAPESAPGAGVTVAFNAPVNNIDTKALAREVAYRQRLALAMVSL